MNERKTLDSGSVLTLQMASFAVSSRLVKAVAKEFQSVVLGDDFKLGGETSIAKLAAMDLPVDGIKNLICQFLGSSAVEAAVWDCMKGCQYNGEAIGKDTFEPEDARQDYLPTAWEVIQLNLA